MDDREYAAALRQELAVLANSPDRPAKDRRIGEVRDELARVGEFDDASDKAPRERAVTRKAAEK